jgi:hypothetical protein
MAQDGTPHIDGPSDDEQVHDDGDGSGGAINTSASKHSLKTIVAM